jgi:hypothetical protein
MPFHIREIPVEVLLLIQDHLESWKDRLSFARVHPHIWESSLLYRCDEQLDLSKEVNRLQLACSTRIKIADIGLTPRLLRPIIRHSYAVKAFVIGRPCSSMKTLADWIFEQIHKHHPQAPKVRIFVDERDLDIWKEVAAKRAIKGNSNMPAVTCQDTPPLAPPDEITHPTPQDDIPFVSHQYDITSHTFQGCATSSNTLNPDLYQTPEHINEHKKWAKRMCIRAGEARLIDNTDGISKSMPLPVIPLLENGAVYQIDDLQLLQYEQLTPTYSIDLSAATDMVKRCASRYIEAVVVFDDTWFLVTSIDVFFHGRPAMDDCADRSNVIMGSTPSARIRVKTKNGHDYYELSIMVGTMELLAVAGFHGTAVSSTAETFLGSSIPDLPSEMKQSITAREVHIRKIPPTYTRSNRHLRQYCKAAANLHWGLHSLRFVTKRFYPINPLSYGDHQSSITQNGRIQHLLASYFLKCAANQTVKKEDIDHMFSIAITNSFLRKHLGASTSFAMTRDHIQASGDTESYTAIVLRNMALLEDVAATNKDDKNLRPELVDMKSKCLQLLDSGLAAALKSANNAICKKFKTAYKF